MPLSEIRLKFRIGDWCLHVHRFPGATWPEHPQESKLPTVPLKPGMEVLFAPSVPVSARLPVLKVERGMIRYVPAHYKRYYLDLAGDFQSFLKGLSHGHRHELRRKTRRLSESSANGLIFREYGRPDQISEFHRIARQLSVRSYQERIGAGLPGDPGFLNELAARAESDAVRGFILFHSDRPAAYQLCYVDGDRLSGVYCGYDPDLRRCSPGLVLLRCVVEHLFAQQRFRSLDFGRGEQAYKAVFATGSTFCADVYYFRRTGTNLCLISAHLALRLLWSIIAGVLEAMGLKTRLRRVIRAHR